MTLGQRFARLATDAVVRAPWLWRLFRRPLAANFDRLAGEWEATRVDERRLRPVTTALAAVPAPPARALDLGTGSGAVARVMAAQWPGAQVTGTDISPGMIREARRLGGERERYEVADAARLPFGDGTFDVVAMNNMIPFFDEIARVTAADGHVVVSYSLGPQTPIWVPLERVRAELERRGFTHVADFAVDPGVSLLARKGAAS